jgi:hypothetical protein
VGEISSPGRGKVAAGGGAPEVTVPMDSSLPNLVMMPMMMRQIANATARIAVNLARSFCMLAPMRAEPPPPPKALVRPVSFESWIRMRSVRRIPNKKTRNERKPQNAPVQDHDRSRISAVILPPMFCLIPW